MCLAIILGRATVLGEGGAVDASRPARTPGPNRSGRARAAAPTGTDARGGAHVMAADEPDSAAGEEADSGAAAVRPFPDPRLTARQRKVLRVIREWVDEHGYPPSVREI